MIKKDKRGYDAVKVGFFKIKNSKITKQMKGYFAKKNTEAKKKLKEYRVSNIENYKEGNEFGLEIFQDVLHSLLNFVCAFPLLSKYFQN